MDKGLEDRRMADERRRKYRDEAMADHGGADVADEPGRDKRRVTYSRARIVSKEQIRLGHVYELSCGHRMRSTSARSVGAWVECVRCPTIVTRRE